MSPSAPLSFPPGDVVSSLSILSPTRMSDPYDGVRGRVKSESRSPTRDRDRKRRRSRSASPPSRRDKRETPDTRGKEQGADSDRDDAPAKKAPSGKAKKAKGSKLFKQTKRDEGDGVDDRDGGKPATGSVDYWNEERAKLGLKPLK